MAKGPRKSYRQRPRLYPISLKIRLSCDAYGWIMAQAAERECSCAQIVREALEAWRVIVTEFETGALRPLEKVN